MFDFISHEINLKVSVCFTVVTMQILNIQLIVIMKQCIKFQMQSTFDKMVRRYIKKIYWAETR